MLPIVSYQDNCQLPPSTTVESENEFTMHILDPAEIPDYLVTQL
jgi:hypothetical protein